MAVGTRAQTHRQLNTLFHSGTFTGLLDQQLIERFASDRDEGAFRALVERHGAMVLHACRSLLRREVDAEDAVQAVFLLLAQRSSPAISKRFAGAMALRRGLAGCPGHAEGDPATAEARAQRSRPRLRPRDLSSSLRERARGGPPRGDRQAAAPSSCRGGFMRPARLDARRDGGAAWLSGWHRQESPGTRPKAAARSAHSTRDGA